MAKMTMRAARVNAGLSQKGVATALSVSNKTVSAWETGKSFPTADKIPLICDLYGLSYDDIIFCNSVPFKGI